MTDTIISSMVEDLTQELGIFSRQMKEVRICQNLETFLTACLQKVFAY